MAVRHAKGNAVMPQATTHLTTPFNLTTRYDATHVEDSAPAEKALPRSIDPVRTELYNGCGWL